MHGNCRCPHHWAAKVMMVLIWVAGVLFFWSSLGATFFGGSSAIFGFESIYYAYAVVVLSLMSFSMKSCGCCGWGKMGEKMMGEDGEHTHMQ